MRLAIALLTAFLFAAAVVRADCPPDCFPGGGPSATDCFVEWGGISSTTTTCADGAACDMDGKIDGKCTFPLKACVNVPGGALGCTPGTLSAPPKLTPQNMPAVRALSAALAGLFAEQDVCTEPGFVVPLKLSLAGAKKATVKLRSTATSGGKKDIDKLVLTCLPGTPSFAKDVEPLLNGGPGGQHCATNNGCHNAANAGTNPPNLDHGAAYASIVGAKGNESKISLVTPHNVGRSYLARKILGKGITGGRMPQDCGVSGSTNCLTDADIATILEWIQSGAPEN